MTYLAVYGFTFGLFASVFLVAQLKQNNGYIDIIWGPGFVAAAWISYLYGNPAGTVPLVMTIFVTVWGLRLGWHLARRNIGKPEDYRYAQMRANWNPKYYYIRIFFKVYMIQFALNVLIGLSVIVSNLQDIPEWSFRAAIGAVCWGIGFLFEAVGDAQLKKFKADPESKGKIMTLGLWRWTRHPNYFGESLQWWGLFVMAADSPGRLFLIVSPLTITGLLLFVSGIPLLEKKYEGREDWEAYKKQTSKFVPMPPGRNRGGVA
ncbi:MAG TPA: DUF1295 domain-containing protein [Bacillota bacterium]|nr:DUF1295 domain-containing protein [Bacillota bacterium]